MHTSNVVVAMVALPLHGHINQLLHLSHRIAAHNLPIHFICTTVHGRQTRLRQQQGSLNHPNTTIIFHDLPIPFSTINPIPTSNTNFPSHLHPLCESATAHLRLPVATLLRELASTSHRLVIIHDSLMGSVVQDFVSLPNAEAYTFHSVSAFSIGLYTSDAAVAERIRTMILEPRGVVKDEVMMEGCFSLEFKRFIAVQHEYGKLSSGRIYNTCKMVEELVLEMLEEEARNKNELVWALGPFNPVEIQRESKFTSKDVGIVARCLNWLDKQASKTVIFVSFGTTTSFSEQQIIEIAIGLEKSDQKFIWVVRDANRGNISNDNIADIQLPEGYEDRVKDRGLVVREWAPQLDILAHPSVGGFMSHCGWNSCVESMSMGVPIVAWPMHSDQPNNALLVTRILEVGIYVKDWSSQQVVVSDENFCTMVVAADVELAVRRLMGSMEGEEVRERAVAMGRRVRTSVRDGGVSRKELESFIVHISR